MQSAIDSNVVVLKLTDGDDLFKSLGAATDKYKIYSGIIVSGLGMLREFELGYFEPGGYKTKYFEEPHELVSMTGSIVYVDKKHKDDVFMPHIHCAVGDSDHRVWGGHLNKGTVNVVNEITILRLTSTRFTRVKNDKTGLMELNIEGTYTW